MANKLLLYSIINNNKHVIDSLSSVLRFAHSSKFCWVFGNF